MKHAFALLPALLLAACGAAAPVEEPEARPTPPPSACRAVAFEETRLTHCIADPKQHTVRTVLAGENGQPLRSFTELALSRGSDAQPVAFAVNGGMYDNAGKPIGYYVEDGKRAQELNRARGLGNFHLLPNGVFMVNGQDWTVLTADAFYDTVTDRPDYATQSGPMLVIDGKLHPAIQDDGPSRYTRNGVGVDSQGRAHFVMSERPVSFGKLARYYRDELGIANALYLDGNGSALWDPARERMDVTVPLGPLIVVEKRATSAAGTEAGEPEDGPA